MRLQEFNADGFRSVTVDREAGVIRGVKLLGIDSRNGRRYAESAIKSAIGLYEGAAVNLDHRKAGESNSLMRRAGVVRGAEFREGKGAYGDLHYLKGDPAGEKLAALAEQAPDSFGMSHDADGDVKRRRGIATVEQIHKVHSVDAVDDPATTSSLSEQTMRKTSLRKLIEATDYKHTTKLLEMVPELPVDEEMAAVEPEGDSPDPIDAVADALAVKVADAIKDPKKSDAEVGQMAKAASKTVASVRSDMEPSAEPSAEPSEGDEPDESDEDTVKESKEIAALTGAVTKLQESLASVTKRDTARSVLEAVNAKPSDQLVAELVECTDRKAMESLVEGWTPAKLGRVRPAMLGRASTAERIPESLDDYAAKIRRR